MTLAARTAGNVPVKVELVPFHSYAAVFRGENAEILRSNFMNVLLFYPVGLLLGSVLPRHWTQWQRVLLIAGFCAVISAGIEYCQYYYCLGTTEIDDVIHNTLGGAVGVLACGFPVNVK